MTDINDDDLKARFDALHDYDAMNAPEFRALVDYARSRRQANQRSAARAALSLAAAAAVIVLGVALAVGKLHESGGRTSAVTAAPTITSWQSPTAGLLETHAKDLMAPPPLLSSVFDSVTKKTSIANAQTEGD